ncbi:pyrroline-5-carboxylate reductase [Shinella sp.]|uniref:pyrroline-5-carboxylate reductase n=1 Tax=Shinella sp. TaxID=1870904 RepID=UPI003F6F24BE
MRLNVILVGCGNMGFSMLSGWLKSGMLNAREVLVVEPVADLRRRAEDLGVAAVPSAAQIADGVHPELIVLAVKPESIGEVVASYERFAGEGTTFLSIAAGVPLAALESMLGRDAPILRCMPNMPAAIGKGITVMASNARVSAKSRDFFARLLSAGGKVEAIDDERLMDAVTAVSGSGPAYLFHFIECLAVAGEDLGLPPDLAMRLARQTVYGAACLAAEPQGDPGELRRQVTSPNGTTAAALAVLTEDDRLKKLLADAVAAARTRSVELIPPA